MKRYSKLNDFLGWLSFLLAFAVYMLTLQPTVSFWDAGEFISAAYKIQVGHQPGAPFFMIIGKVFSLLAADPSWVAFWINTLSALASALTVMFLFWTITALALKLVKQGSELLPVQQLVIFSAGLTGSLAYAFSDSFWFSAVEAEVYALSSLCTAIVFWAAIKWQSSNDNKWLVLIAYLIGLSIGIHLLSLLVIPAVILLYYFHANERINLKGLVISILAACAVLALVQYGIVQYLVLFAFKTDLFFVNTLNLGFGTGALFFAVLLFCTLAYGLWYSQRKQWQRLNLSLICISFIILGYSSYAMIVIRANAKTSINISNPDNAFSLYGYLGRIQYGDTPLLFGQYFDSQFTGVKDRTQLYRKGKEQYEPAGEKLSYSFDRNTVLPRIYSDDEDHKAFYRNWLRLSSNDRASFSDNLKFLTSYQLGFMYVRYLLWNFAGRQNDIQGFGDKFNGNWITGIQPLDKVRLGSSLDLPSSKQNEGYNLFYCLPLVIGLAGLLFHAKRNGRDAAVLGTLFFFTGIAIVLYLNQSPLQVRERDYAYVGSFYVFAIWIGLGVLGIHHWIGRVVSGRVSAALLATGFCLLAAPVNLLKEGWNDHDRSDNFVAYDMAVNILESCAPNAILFTNADNDTYPLWYVQEVEGIRTDVRIVNQQLLFDPGYITALKKDLYNSKALPLSMSEEKYQSGVRDVIYYFDYGIADSVELKDIFEVLISDNEADKVEMQDGSKRNILPTKNFHLTVDKKALLQSGTLKQEELPNVVDRMEWKYNKDYVSRADLAMIDIISHNKWERPIYFTTSLTRESYFGLDRYLQLEGYAYRVLPFQRDENDQRDKSEVTNSDVFYTNLTGKLKLRSFNQASYLDPESRRVAKHSWSLLNTLASNLIDEGKKPQAKEVMQKALDNLPNKNYGIMDTVDKYNAATNLYRLKEISKANLLVESSAEFLDTELQGYAAMDLEEQEVSAEKIQYILSILEAFKSEAGRYQQVKIVNAINNIYTSVEGKLGEG